MKWLLVSLLSIGVFACSKSADETVDSASVNNSAEHVQVEQKQLEKIIETDSQRLDRILAAQPDDAQARYVYRHPKETIEFFGLKPGMTVVEVLPGGGWYSRILAPYLGREGRLIGVDYAAATWGYFDWVTEEFLAEREAWPKTWSADVSSWSKGDEPTIVGTNLGALGPYYDGQADAVLFIRALHNLHRLQPEQTFFDQALVLSAQLLKPDGIVGVVQHQAPDSASLEWADGSRGYLNKTQLIDKFKQAGFVLVGDSAMNENPLDQPTESDIVWRLPPSYYTAQGDEQVKAKYRDIGESHRMTLLFKRAQ